jgi:hypothetical protein
MAMFKTLEALKAKTERSGGSLGVSRDNFLSLKSGESVKIFFRQELTEDGKGFDDKFGAANIVTIHVSPVDFVKKMVCTLDSEADGNQCWACSASRLPGNESLRPKRRLLINVLAKEGDIWVPKILETSISPRGNMPGNTLIAFQEEYGTLMDREYKFSRVGEKLNTAYSIIPFSLSDLPDAHHESDVIDTSSVYRSIAYADQQEYMMTERDQSAKPASDGSDW